MQTFVIAIAKGSRNDSVAVTARTEELAKLGAAITWPGYQVGEVTKIVPAGHYYAGLDASDYTDADLPWLRRQVERRAA